MAPLTPHWKQPSHADVLTVNFTSATEFTSSATSNVKLAPFEVLAKFEFPPCTKADKPTYATVQYGKNEHLNLNSDIVYCNHSCEPSLIFDTSSMTIYAGPKGIEVNQELTFFYPSTEWDMAQGFQCNCGTATCRGFISGAKNMKKDQLSGLFLNAHIRNLLDERGGLARTSTSPVLSENDTNLTNFSKPLPTPAASGASTPAQIDPTEASLRAKLHEARKQVDAAQKALHDYKTSHGNFESGNEDGGVSLRRGVSSRELSGEMGGDTYS